MTLSLKQLVRRGFTTRQAQALIENTPEVKAFPEHFANPTGDVAGLTAVLPKVASYPAGGGFEQADYYAGLVTVPAGAVPEAVLLPNTHLRYGWYLASSDTPMTLDGVVNFAGYGGGQEHPAGAYLAIYITVPDADGGSVPTALPDGWTAGNTTGAGPVLPFLGEEDGYSLWGGLVYAEAGAVRPPNGPGNSGWALMDPAMPLAYNAINNDGISLGWGLPGVYLATYFNSPQTPAVPIALPTGLTFQPYGVGAAGPVLAALGEAVKTTPPPSVFVSFTGTMADVLVNNAVPFVEAGRLSLADYTGITDVPDLEGVTVNESNHTVNVPQGGLYAVSWVCSIFDMGTSAHDGKHAVIRLNATGLTQTGSDIAVPILGGTINCEGSFVEYFPHWGPGGYSMPVLGIKNNDGTLTPLPSAATVSARLMIQRIG